jgi:hypothetical protein
MASVALAKHREFGLSVRFSTSSMRKWCAGVVETGRLPTNAKSRSLPGQPVKTGSPVVSTGVSSVSDPMSVLHRKRQLNTGQRRALELLAAAGEQGCTGARLFNHGFTVGMLADLVWSGLATGHRETVRVGYRKIKVARIRITDAGRRALEG